MRHHTRIVVALSILAFTGVVGAEAQDGTKLPPAPKELQDRPTRLVLRLSQEGLPSINDHAIPWERLDAELKAIFEHRPEKVLLIQTTPKNRVEDVRRILVMTKRYGIQVYALHSPEVPG